MAYFHSPRIVTDGLIHLLETSYFNGTSSQTINNKKPTSVWTLTNYSNGNTAGVLTLKTDTDVNGSGTSFINVSRNSELETGSITFMIWFNLQNIPINVGANNNWRHILRGIGSAEAPLSIILEQSSVINFSTTTTDAFRRHLNSSFAPVSADSNGWQMVSFTYNSSSGTATCYKNSTQIRTGPMTTDTNGTSPTLPGTQLTYTGYQAGSGGFRIYGGTNVGVSNPNGSGVCPGEVGNVMIYNRALTAEEVLQNYNATKGRFGL